MAIIVADRAANAAVLARRGRAAGPIVRNPTERRGCASGVALGSAARPNDCPMAQPNLRGRGVDRRALAAPLPKV